MMMMMMMIYWAHRAVILAIAWFKVLVEIWPWDSIRDLPITGIAEWHAHAYWRLLPSDDSSFAILELFCECEVFVHLRIYGEVMVPLNGNPDELQLRKVVCNYIDVSIVKCIVSFPRVISYFPGFWPVCSVCTWCAQSRAILLLIAMFGGISLQQLRHPRLLRKWLKLVELVLFCMIQTNLL